MKFIVITSIYPPTKAVTDFAALRGYQLIVVGDKKSPDNWNCENVAFLSVADQAMLDFGTGSLLPYNHYCRKMLGYLHAIRQGATVIIDTDDDNLPKAGWDFPAFRGTFLLTPSNAGFLNVYKYFTKQHIWPRGLPLKRIADEAAIIDETLLTLNDSKVGVWQGLADGDPDVDAIYRLVYDAPCYFNDREPIVLNMGTLCPYNSQNTATVKELFALLYLPCFVTFRFTDILRGLVAQPIMWLYGYHLGFTKATVVQERNPHDYLKDFESEIPCYLQPDTVIRLVTEAISPELCICDNLRKAYEALEKNGIVTGQEVLLVNAWINDINRLT